MAAELGLNRRMVRAVYPKVDWDQYDREVIAESLPDYLAAVEALEELLDDAALPGVPLYEPGDETAWDHARAALARLRDEVPA